jgi:hypothetical protein
MDKGIRPYCNAKFLAELPARVNTRDGNCAFRKTVMADCMEAFGITLASAATHYNHAFITVKKATPELVLGLGRPDDKKGGRKPKAKAADAVDNATTADVLASNVLGTASADETADETPAPAVIVDIDTTALQAGAAPGEQTVFTVRKKGDNSVVAEGVSFEAAQELINKAAAAKKAKLYFV